MTPTPSVAYFLCSIINASPQNGDDRRLGYAQATLSENFVHNVGAYGYPNVAMLETHALRHAWWTRDGPDTSRVGRVTSDAVRGCDPHGLFHPITQYRYACFVDYPNGGNLQAVFCTFLVTRRDIACIR